MIEFRTPGSRSPIFVLYTVCMAKLGRSSSEYYGIPWHVEQYHQRGASGSTLCDGFAVPRTLFLLRARRRAPPRHTLCCQPQLRQVCAVAYVQLCTWP